MPADLATVNGEITMAYQGATPWHQLGAKVDDPTVVASVPKFLEAANLNWEVQLKSMFYRVGDRSVKVPSRRAVVRDTDGKLLATVGGDYHVMQNREAFDVLQPACDKFSVKIETAGALGKGDRVWMLAKLPKSIEPIPGDRIDNYLFVLTGHNGWTSYSARLTQVRVVCANTVQLALQDKAMVTLKHTATEAEKLDQIAEVITGMLEVAKKTGESYKTLAAKLLTLEETKSYIEEVLHLDYTNPVAARRRDTVLELAGRTAKGRELAPDSLWNAFNAVTEYVDHVRPAEAKVARTIQQANESALFGTNAKIKLRALTVARRIAA